MTFEQMRQQGNEEAQRDLNFDTDISDLPCDLITLMNPNEGHQDEPVDPVTV